MKWVRAAPVLVVLLFLLGNGLLSCNSNDSNGNSSNGSGPTNPPSADAGTDQTVVLGALVTLDGSGSSDPDGDQHTFRWAFVAIPDGSMATLSDPTAERPTFTADVVDVYTISLVVNDGTVDSARDTVTITATEPGPSLVSVDGRQLIVQKRHADGTLGPALPYIIRGVVWSPASRKTNTSPADPNNAGVRRLEFATWHGTDIPLLAAMHANTVRLVIDPGFDPMLGPPGLSILDALYSNDIMVIMTVDNGINDLERVEQAVNFYKDHPAILLWMLGSEWNINRYFGVASSVEDAARRTEAAAALIKTLDQNHPVATSYGDININANGLRLTDTQHYVTTLAPSVDVWGLNIFRGRTFATLFDEWASITTKPMFLGEFGSDAFLSTALTFPPPGIVDEAMQAEWDQSLWHDLFRNLSANDPAKVALGGSVFAWNDEWWKVPPASSQETGGFILPGGHPDDFANEEYFGIVTIDRETRQVYAALQIAFDPAFEPPPQAVTFQAVSRGASVPGGGLGFAQFYKDDTLFYDQAGGGGGGRGFNVAAIDAVTGQLLYPAQNFDTWFTRDTGTAMTALIAFLQGLPENTLLLLAVADEAGLTLDNSCTLRSSPWTEEGLQTLEALESQQIRNYCFRDSWAMMAVTGEGQAREEAAGHAVEVAVQTTLSIP